LLELVEKIILKKRVELPENLNDFLDLVILIIVKHGAFPGFKPPIINPNVVEIKRAIRSLTFLSLR
jgi:hypothetical protein